MHFEINDLKVVADNLSTIHPKLAVSSSVINYFLPKRASLKVYLNHQHEMKFTIKNQEMKHPNNMQMEEVPH